VVSTGENRNIYRAQVRKLKERENWKDLGRDLRIILKWTLKK
jgi:hypothetical protein